MTHHHSSLLSGRRQRMVWMSLVSLLAITALLLSACGGGGGGGANASAKSHTLTIGVHVGSDYQNNFNPYNPTADGDNGIKGMVYEPLMFFNRNDGSTQYLLATNYAWSNNQKELTFTTRQGVKWSDGKSFTANDVAFTFNMLKQYPAADTNGLWVYLDKVTATNDNTVVVDFKTANPPLLWYLAGQTPIVPQHTFQGQDAAKFTNTTPVGTGPFTLSKFSPQLLTYTKNASSWQASNVQAQTLHYVSVKDNQTLQLDLMKGTIDWGSFFAPNLDQTFVQKDTTHNHYWMAPTDMFTLYVNLTKAPFNNVAVRQAISAALDRGQLSKQAESGYVDPASTTGLILPNAKDYLDPQFATTQTTADAAKAADLLKSAGYTKGTDGFFAKNGQKLSFSIKVVNGWTDWETMASVIVQNLKNAGINASVDDIQQGAYFDARNNGNYDALIGGLFGGPTPFYLYNTHLNTANLSPKGYNWGKWSDPQTDKLLQQYTATTDPAKQKTAIEGIEKIYAQQLPNIPLVNAAAWDEYSTKNFTNFPDKTNPYAIGAAYTFPDNEIVVTHLTPAS